MLFRSPGFGNHWIAVKAVGVKTNRSAIGARIRVQILEDGKRRSVYRYVGSGGSFGASPLRQNIGLGKATRIESLDIYWPTTGVTQTFRDVPVDRAIQVVEGASSYSTLPLKTFKLGGK